MSTVISIATGLAALLLIVMALLQGCSFRPKDNVPEVIYGPPPFEWEADPSSPDEGPDAPVIENPDEESDAPVVVDPDEVAYDPAVEDPDAYSEPDPDAPFNPEDNIPLDIYGPPEMFQ